MGSARRCRGAEGAGVGVAREENILSTDEDEDGDDSDSPQSIREVESSHSQARAAQVKQPPSEEPIGPIQELSPNNLDPVSEIDDPS